MVSLHEKALLKELRESPELEFSDDLEDFILMTYLRASKMDVNTAIILLNRAQETRHGLMNRMDRKSNYLNYQSLEEISNDMTYKSLDCDKEGRPVYWLPVGRWHPSRHVQNGLMDEFWLHVFKCIYEGYHQIYEIALKTGIHQKAILILDLKGLSFSKIGNYSLAHSALKILIDFQKVANLIHKIYIVDAPWIANYVLHLLKPYLKRTTSGKIEQLNLKENEWKKFLGKRFQVDILAKEFGGKAQVVLD